MEPGGNKSVDGTRPRLSHLVLEPEDVQANFVALQQAVVGERPESLSLLALVAILGVVAADESLHGQEIQLLADKRPV